MKGEKELKALLDILALDSSVYARIQVSVCREYLLNKVTLMIIYANKYTLRQWP